MIRTWSLQFHDHPVKFLPSNARRADISHMNLILKLNRNANYVKQLAVVVGVQWGKSSSSPVLTALHLMRMEINQMSVAAKSDKNGKTWVSYFILWWPTESSKWSLADWLCLLWMRFLNVYVGDFSILELYTLLLNRSGKICLVKQSACYMKKLCTCFIFDNETILLHISFHGTWIVYEWL